MEKELLEEFWALGLEELKTVMQLYELKGDFINLACPMGRRRSCWTMKSATMGLRSVSVAASAAMGLRRMRGSLWCMNTATAARTRSWLSGSAAADRKIGADCRKERSAVCPLAFFAICPAPGARIIMGDDD